MSSSRTPLTAAIAILATTLMATMGCAPPPPAHPPVQMVRIEGKAVRVACQCDGDDEAEDDDDDMPPPRPPVQYVTMAEWQPPESVKRIESEVVPANVGGGGGAIPFPKLTLHRPIGETGVRGRWPSFPSRQR